jgi:excisionase family DNA binding protein
MDKLLTVNEAAERLCLRPSTIRKWLLRRELSYVKVGKRSIRIAEREVDRMITLGSRPRITDVEK